MQLVQICFVTWNCHWKCRLKHLSVTLNDSYFISNMYAVISIDFFFHWRFRKLTRPISTLVKHSASCCAFTLGNRWRQFSETQNSFSSLGFTWCKPTIHLVIEVVPEWTRCTDGYTQQPQSTHLIWRLQRQTAGAILWPLPAFFQGSFCGKCINEDIGFLSMLLVYQSKERRKFLQIIPHWVTALKAFRLKWE